jgi:hypothetical protein
MKTTCYCILCPKHPFYAKRKELSVLTGWRVGWLIYKPEDVAGGAVVDCLEPVSYAFDELNIDPGDYEFPITAYEDGCALTGFHGRGFEIEANCDNEEYIEEDNK